MGNALQGMCLEVVSPYFDDGPESAPIVSLLETFEPREVRVFLPKSDRGEAECSPALFSWVRSQGDVSWGALPSEFLRLGKGEEAKHRAVHANAAVPSARSSGGVRSSPKCVASADRTSRRITGFVTNPTSR